MQSYQSVLQLIGSRRLLAAHEYAPDTDISNWCIKQARAVVGEPPYAEDPMSKLEPLPGAKPRPTAEQRRREGALTMAATTPFDQAYRLGEMIVTMADEMIAMREALLWYADPENFGDPRHLPGVADRYVPALNDCGGRARQALGLIVLGVSPRDAFAAALDAKHSQLDNEKPFDGELLPPR